MDVVNIALTKFELVSGTLVSAAAVLDLGVRQTFRLMSRYEAGGAPAWYTMVVDHDGSDKGTNSTSELCWSPPAKQW